MRRLAVIAAVLLASCANVADPDDLRAPRNAAEQREFDEQAVRLDRVVKRLWSGASSLCKNPDPAVCLTPHIGVSSKIGAFAGDGRFIISTGLMRALKTDDEIALIAAHEWSHTLLNHGAGMSIADREHQADCLGTIIAMAANYDVIAGLRAHREVMAPLERQQRGERIALLMVGVVSITEYPPAESRISRIEAIHQKVMSMPQRGKLSRQDIREICGVAP